MYKPQYREPVPANSPLALPILIMALFVAVAILGVGTQNRPVARVDIQEPSRAQPAQAKMQELSAHAAQTHAEAHAIHAACLQHLQAKPEAMKAGRLQVFKKKGEDRFIILCQYGEHLWGIEIREGDGTSVTAFRPSDGSLKEVMKYLLNIATRFTGDLPWLIP